MFNVQTLRDFRNTILTDSQTGILLEEAITWIKENLPPEQVFNEQDLEYWAEENGYKKYEN